MDLHISCRKMGYGIRIVAIKALATAKPLYPPTIIIPLQPAAKDQQPNSETNKTWQPETHHNQHSSSKRRQMVAASTNTGYDATMAKQ